MKKSFLAVLTGFLILQGCGLSKDVQFEDKTVEERQIERKSITRPSDTVSVERKYNVILKDTVIYTKSYDTRTIIRETYDEQGNQTIDCIPEEIREDIEKINEKIDRDIEERKNFEVKVDLTPMIYAIAVLVLVVVLAMIVGLVMIANIKKAVPGMISEALRALEK